MITKEDARRLYNYYSQIETTEKLLNDLEKFIHPLGLALQIQRTEQGLQTGGFGVLLGRGRFGGSMGVGISATLENSGFILGQVGEQLSYHFGLKCRVYKLDGILVQLSCGLVCLLCQHIANHKVLNFLCRC